MDFSNEHSKLITGLINEFIADPSPGQNDLRRLAADKQVLPLFLDSGGILTINGSGEILSFLWEDTSCPRVENDPRIRNLALFQGSRKFPKLKDLVPVKPNNAQVCQDCGGTGIYHAIKKIDADNIVCYCGGLGWLP